MQLRIALAQMLCEKGALDANLEATVRIIREAADRGVDIVGFPEASLTGYVDPSRYPEALLRLDGDIIIRLLAATRDIETTALVGIVELRPAELPYVTQLVIRNGELLGIYRKRTIVDDDLFQYTAGSSAPIFHHKGLPFGIAICSDLGNEEVFAAAARQGAAIVFELAAPGLYGEQATRNWQSGFQWWEGECRKYLSTYARTYGIWTAVATQAGRTIDEDFPGGAYLFDPTGRRRFAPPDGSPGVVALSLDLDTGTVTPLA